MFRGLSVIAAVALAARAGHAGPSAAEAAFERGRVLLDQGKLAEACGAFAESVRLDFQFGALFNLASCEEQRGNFATALAAFRRIAAEDQNPTRAGRSREHVASLEPRVSRLHVTVAGAGAKLVLDGRAVELGATPIPLDPGTHGLVVAAPGMIEQTRTIELTREGELVEVAIDLQPVVLSGTRDLPKPVPPRSRRTEAIVLGAGATTAVAGLVVGGLALHGWHDAQDRARTDPAGANGDLDHVRLLGNTSTVLVGAGVVAIAVGIYLWQR